MLPSQATLLMFAGTCLFMLLGFVVTFLVIRHNNRLNFLHLEKNQMISESRKRHIEENERMMNQISKELHDNIGQVASLLRSSLYKASHLAADNQELKKIIGSTATLTEQIMRDAKNISHSLNQDFIKARNLHALLEQDLEYIRSFQNIDFEFDILGEAKRLSPESKLIVYRIAQESFHNISKHAHASHIRLLIEYGKESFKMQVSDNGIGLPPEKMVARDGIGLANMRERAAFLEGEIVIDSSVGNGCTISLIVNKFKFNTPDD